MTVYVETVADELATQWRKSNHAKARSTTCYRIVRSDGQPLLVGLFASLEAAGTYARNRGWKLRPGRP